MSLGKLAQPPGSLVDADQRNLTARAAPPARCRGLMEINRGRGSRDCLPMCFGRNRRGSEAAASPRTGNAGRTPGPATMFFIPDDPPSGS
jgi:hypothetical protein